MKESTLSMKDNIIDTKLIPYFGKKCMREITTKDIMLWQNELLTYRNRNFIGCDIEFGEEPHKTERCSAFFGRASWFFAVILLSIAKRELQKPLK